MKKLWLPRGHVLVLANNRYGNGDRTRSISLRNWANAWERQERERRRASRTPWWQKLRPRFVR